MASVASTITFVAYLLGNASHMAPAFELNSTAFSNQEPIPAVYSCQGLNTFIPLSWHGAPLETRSYVLMMSDPDEPKGVWYNWELYNIPAQMSQMNWEQPMANDSKFFAVNSRHHRHYDGPCPGTPGQHRYVIKLYALDTRLYFNHPVEVNELMHAMHGHVLAETKLEGSLSGLNKK